MKIKRNQLKAIASFAQLFVSGRRKPLLDEYFYSVSCEGLDKIQTQLKRAGDRELCLAQAKLQVEYRKQLTDLREQIQHVLQSTLKEPGYFIDTKSLISDLQSLEDYFLDVSVKRGERSIEVVTKPIELENRLLGRFKIKLQIPKERIQKCSYRVVALDEEYSASDSSISHPHVQSEILCEGDAAGSIARSLEQGRLLDFFQIVNSVLSTYNSESAYRRLDEWDEVTCSDCGDSCEPSETCSCAECNSCICDHCLSRCRTCDECHCGGCIQICSGCLERSCDACIKHCDECDQCFCSDCFSTNNMCKACQEHIENEAIKNQQPETPIHADSLGKVAVSA